MAVGTTDATESRRAGRDAARARVLYMLQGPHMMSRVMLELLAERVKAPANSLASG